MQVKATSLPGVLILEPALFADDRGFFTEQFNARVFAEATGFRGTFVQDNLSRSLRGVVRGLHYQLEQPQSKLVTCSRGEIFDVAVDFRRGSPHFGQWTGFVLSEANRQQAWIPPGFGHGFVALSDVAEVFYKVDAFRHASGERSICWNDPEIGIDWPLAGSDARLSPKDEGAPGLSRAEIFEIGSIGGISINHDGP
ncbi:MAG: dTDP-4-dehydrorhamnose 3,5-epimerase [Betaproteobacteria bacterium]|jgi:dTDP-4-dehydrorhamnose 3,5-epimerase|nr:dTDP-4-dehydrorhamnose 3,5-epimerase [Betaproteobacteria bacterium]NBY17452.1 dTDP-4-dehydrorhamnose 3,5-epimerase [Betaproteobacteria bacterium]